MGSAVGISRAVFEALLADARATPGFERCGLLIGRGDRIAEVWPVRNVHPEPARHFELDPAALFAALRAARSGGPEVIGHYHFHPTGDCRPSATDRAAALGDDRLWLIISAEGWGLWRSVSDGDSVAFVAIALDIAD